jgi:hypothetical protein
MPPLDADLSVRLRAVALAKGRVVKLTRVRQYGGGAHGKTLMFTFEGGQRRASRSRCSFISPQNVAPFEGEEGWFVVEEVRAKPWPYWRAICQVDPPPGR